LLATGNDNNPTNESYLDSESFTQQEESAHQVMVPSSFFHILLQDDIKTQSTVFLIEASSQKAYLITFSVSDPITADNKESVDFRIIREFNIATGKQKGSKSYEWDLRTPQGVYYITQYRAADTLAPKYGPAAFVLDYPNVLDRLHNRSGSGIWIHGTDRVSFIDQDSEGCIRLKNEEIVELTDLLKPSQTPVIIVDKIVWTTLSQLISDQKEFIDAFQNWHQAWLNNDIEKYLRFYDRSFYAPYHKMDLVRWSTAKRIIAQENPPTEISFSNLSFHYFQGELVVTAHQLYNSAQNSDTGLKTLLWHRLEDKWQILIEDWE